MPGDYYEALPPFYEARRDLLLSGLREAGFACTAPAGSYYIMADFSAIDATSSADDFAMSLLKDGGVAAVPAPNFYLTPGLGTRELRFAFCKRLDTLEAAVSKLKVWSSRMHA
jgi:aspartate/methionine/tyrosine aminotransferase